VRLKLAATNADPFDMTSRPPPTAHAEPVRRRLASESGYSLVEVMLVTSLLIVVLGAVLSVVDSSGRLAAKDIERGTTLNETKTQLYKMTRELRQAHRVYAATPFSMEVQASILGSDRRVLYRCDVPHPSEAGVHQCLRYPVSGGSAGAGEVVIPQVLNGPPGSGPPDDPIFAYTPATGIPRYATVTVHAPARGERKDGHAHRIFYSDGIFMRNCRVGTNCA
jgi:hypothetical protein